MTGDKSRSIIIPVCICIVITVLCAIAIFFIASANLHYAENPHLVDCRDYSQVEDRYTVGDIKYYVSLANGKDILVSKPEYDSTIIGTYYMLDSFGMPMRGFVVNLTYINKSDMKHTCLVSR